MDKTLQHLAIIMDGNRRWAKDHGLPSLEGHRRGYEKLKDVAGWCIKQGIKVLTVYAFSTENWNRTAEEVSYLMDLFRRALGAEANELDKQGIRIKVIGQKERLAPDLQALIVQTEQKTKLNDKLFLNIAVSYGGRPEIVEAVKHIIQSGVTSGQVSEDLISANLLTAGTPDPDLVIRTSGECRLSNFLIWQTAYSELLFISKHWPDFSENDLAEAIREYQQRQRRFGK